MNLVLRLTEATQGSILIDGIDISRVKLARLRAAVGFVPQTPFLFEVPVDTYPQLESNLSSYVLSVTAQSLLDLQLLVPRPCIIDLPVIFSAKAAQM